MNFGEMKAAIADDLDEDPDTRAGGNPFGLKRFIVQGVNKAAHDHKIFYAKRIGAFSAGVSSYCLPDIYELKACNLIADTGEAYAPGTVLRGQQEADYRLPRDWARETGTTNPSTVIFTGVNGVQFYRKPLTDRANAFALWGWAIPGKFWVYAPDTSGVIQPVELANDHENPLPSWAHDLCLLEARIFRATVDKRPEIRALLPDLRDQARHERGNVYRDSIKFSDALVGDGMSGCLGTW